MLKLTLIIAGILAIGMLFLCVGVFFSGRFRSQHIGHSRAMRQRGIHCVQSMDAMERKTNPHRASEMERSRK